MNWIGVIKLSEKPIGQYGIWSCDQPSSYPSDLLTSSFKNEWLIILDSSYEAWSFSDEHLKNNYQKFFCMFKNKDSVQVNFCKV